MPKHALVLGELEGRGSTQFVVPDSSKEELRSAIQQNMAFVFDLQAPDIDELLETGRTETTEMLTSKRQVITLTFCDCGDPGSHRRD